jgi:ribosomal protein S18 acetylase RimI-like enzyme
MDGDDVTVSVARLGDLTAAHLSEIASFVAARNGDPRQHIGYLGHDPDQVAAELRDLDGDALFVTARHGARWCGLLGAEWDLDLPRTWWHGPWADTPELMDRLCVALLPHLPPAAAPHEVFCDAQNTAVVDFAARHGFARHGEQAILRFGRDQLHNVAPVVLPRLQARWHEQFAALHDRAFPGTYAPSRVLLADPPPTFVAADGGTLLGYVTLKLQADSHDAQIEYLAVEESARGQGLGAKLVAAALHETFADDRFRTMDLVTDDDNPAARRLYERVGFTVLHEMRSFRAEHLT